MAFFRDPYSPNKIIIYLVICTSKVIILHIVTVVYLILLTDNRYEILLHHDSFTHY